MPTFKIIALKVLVFAVIFILLSELLAWICIPANSQDRVVFHDFYQQENLDVVFVGASTMYRSIVPEIIDEKLNSNCFIMSSDGEKMVDSYYWLLEMYEAHKPSLVVMELNANRLVEKAPDSTMRLFVEYKWSANRLSYLLSGFKSSDYIRALLPGVYYAPEVLTSTKLISNPLEKLKDDYVNYIYDYDDERGLYSGKGHFSTTMLMPQKNFGANPIWFSMPWNPDKVSAESVDYFNKIVDLCAANNSKLLCISSPVLLNVAFETYDYQGLLNYLHELTSSRGLEYYNFTLLWPKVLDNGEYGFRDPVHMNDFGAEPYSKVLASFLSDYLAGTLKPDDYLAPDFSARMAAEPSRVLGVQLKLNAKNARLEAVALADKSVTPEYEFQFRKSGEKEFTALREYGTESRYSLGDLPAGEYVFRVNSRARGSDVDFDQYFELNLKK